MIHFNKYTGKELQNFIAMLNQCETEKITEIRYVRTEIEKYLHKSLYQKRVKEVKNKIRYKKYKKEFKCPSCEKGYLQKVVNTEGLNIFGCPLCRYSEIREIKSEVKNVK